LLRGLYGGGVDRTEPLPDTAILQLAPAETAEFRDDNVDGGALGDLVDAGKKLPWNGGHSTVSQDNMTLEVDGAPGSWRGRSGSPRDRDIRVAHASPLGLAQAQG
jgi:hypothetical protein